MKQTSSVPRRTALAIAAASAGLTLAVTATVASSLGLIAPAAPVAAPSTGQEQPIRQSPASVMNDGIAANPPATVGQPATAEMTRQAARVEEGRSARREHDDDHRDEKLRRSPTNGEGVAWSASRVVSRAYHRDDDDD